MVPIQQILHRIQWDAAFGAARFEIGYLDRKAGGIVRVPFRRVVMATGANFSFDLVNEDGTARMVPFHRVRKVWRDGALIWEREVPGSLD